MEHLPGNMLWARKRVSINLRRLKLYSVIFLITCHTLEINLQEKNCKNGEAKQHATEQPMRVIKSMRKLKTAQDKCENRNTITSSSWKSKAAQDKFMGTVHQETRIIQINNLKLDLKN